MSENYVNMLIYLDRHKRSLAGDTLPAEGYVQSKNFSLDKDLRNGIFGVLEGNISGFVFESEFIGFWVIMRTEQEQLIPIYPQENRYKFRCGFVRFMTNSYVRVLKRFKKIHKVESLIC